jgi:hypothetical protein
LGDRRSAVVRNLSLEICVLLPGDWVDVLPASEILATLDADQALDGLQFMPEMLPSCGGRYRVALRAEKTCVHPPEVPFRRLAHAVVLEGLRCDGSQHGGCQLGCMIYWKEAWLGGAQAGGEGRAQEPASPARLRTMREADPDAYMCQATELIRATHPGEPLWSPSQYVRYLKIRTFTPRELGMLFARPLLRRVKRLARSLSPRRPAQSPDPAGVPALQSGDWVQVRTSEEIAQTLDARGTHAGLWFGGEMQAYCGHRMRVTRRVERILDESTGRIRPIRDTVLLDGAICDRYFGCARGMPLMWREVWLKRIEAAKRHG